MTSAALALALAVAAGAPAAAPPSATPPAASAPAAPAPLPDADPIGFHARADKARAKLGEPFGYWVEIRHVPAEWYVLRGEPALAPFRAEGVRCRRDVEKGEARTTCTMQLALFALGDVDVPDLVFEVDRPAGKARLAVPGPRITGVGVIDPSAPPDAVQLRDVAPPAPLLVRTLRPLWWALGILGGLALLALGFLAWRRLRARRSAAAVLSPAERFERRLRGLEAERLFEHGRGDEHVTRLSEAVREYLSAVTGLPALDLTTGELLGALAGAPDPRIDAAGLELFLRGADLVKFARQPAGAELCASGLEWAFGLLARTRPPPPQALPPSTEAA